MRSESQRAKSEGMEKLLEGLCFEAYPTRDANTIERDRAAN